jgi:hypothetical protein
MACAMMTYNNVTPEAWDSLVRAVAQYGIPITTDSGNTSSHGFAVIWNYDRPSKVLHLQCTDRPFFAPCSTVNSYINDAVEKCLEQHNVTVAAMVPLPP